MRTWDLSSCEGQHSCEAEPALDGSPPANCSLPLCETRVSSSLPGSERRQADRLIVEHEGAVRANHHLRLREQSGLSPAHEVNCAVNGPMDDQGARALEV